MSELIPAITILGVLNGAAGAIQADTATQAFVTANYGSTLNIYVGLDRVNPPGESVTPFLCLTPAPSPYDMGQAPANDERSVSFEIYWGIVDKNLAVNNTTKTTTQTGLTNVDALGQLILQALANYFTDTLYNANYILYGEEPPLFEGAMSCRIVQAIGINSEPTLDHA